ncbi:MAG TPA: hypothetical protein VNS33_08595 [Bradyrhizobium sp.]|nr:hypothetical protein [Bradyrhizobium sp.]
MATRKLLSAALFAAAVIAAPAMARQHHVTSRHSTDSAYASPESYAVAPDAPYGYRAYGYRCVPAPRVGSFAGQPWDNDVPCEPWTGAAY